MPKQKRRKRHVKRQWGKIDVDDLHTAALKKTQDELEGGKLSSRANEALFTIDTVKRSSAPLSRAEKKAKARAFVSTADKIIALNPNTKVTTTIGTKKRKIGEADEKEIKRLQNKLAKTGEVDVSAAKKAKKSKNNMDLWGQEESDELEEILAENPTLDRGYLVTPKPKIKKNKRAPQAPVTSLPAVELPKGGRSYNPSFEDHQEVLKKAYDEEMTRRAQEKRFKEMMKREQYASDMKDDLEAKASSDDDNVDSSDDEDESDKSDDKDHVNIAFVDRKLTKDRNKERRLRKLELIKRDKVNENALIKKLNKIDEFAKEVKISAEEVERRKAEREEWKLLRSKQPRRLGPDKMPKSEAEFTLTEELSSNLRTAKADVNLLKDRFVSFQKRGLVEYRKEKNYHRRYDQMHKEKFPHKEFVKEQEAKYGA